MCFTGGIYCAPEGYISHATVLNQAPRAFRKSVMQVFQSLRNVPTVLRPGKSTLSIQFWLDNMAKGPHADVLIIGYSSCDTPVLMRYDAVLTAHTTEPHLEVGVPVCYLNERGATIVPYGKYRYCQTDTITEIGFVYENKPKKSRIVCINDAGKELFYVFKCDNGPDYLKEGLFRMMDEQGRIGFADSSGNVVIHPQFLYATPFANGHAYVTEHGGRATRGNIHPGSRTNGKSLTGTATNCWNTPSSKKTKPSQNCLSDIPIHLEASGVLPIPIRKILFARTIFTQR